MLPTDRMVMAAFLAGLVCLTTQWAEQTAEAEMKARLAPDVTVEPYSEDFDLFTLPQWTPLHVLLQTPVSSGNNQLNDPVEAILSQDVYLYDKLLLSKNTRLIGHIAALVPPESGHNAIIGFQFDQIIFPSGGSAPIRAYVRTDRGDHTFGGELTPGTIPKRVTHRPMWIGPYNKVVFGGPRAMGEHVSFHPGELWTVILESPLSFRLPHEERQALRQF